MTKRSPPMVPVNDQEVGGRPLQLHNIVLVGHVQELQAVVHPQLSYQNVRADCLQRRDLKIIRRDQKIDDYVVCNVNFPQVHPLDDGLEDGGAHVLRGNGVHARHPFHIVPAAEGRSQRVRMRCKDGPVGLNH